MLSLHECDYPHSGCPRLWTTGRELREPRPGSAGAGRCGRPRVGPRPSIDCIEHVRLCHVDGPRREVQRVGRVVLGPHGISFGRLDILLIRRRSMRVFISSILADTSALNDCHWLSARSAVSAALSATAARVASAFALAAAMRVLICSLVSLREASSDVFRSATRACSESTCSDSVMASSESSTGPSAITAAWSPGESTCQASTDPGGRQPLASSTAATRPHRQLRRRPAC